VSRANKKNSDSARAAHAVNRQTAVWSLLEVRFKLRCHSAQPIGPDTVSQHGANQRRAHGRVFVTQYR
jgi:hypothetical protein